MHTKCVLFCSLECGVPLVPLLREYTPIPYIMRNDLTNQNTLSSLISTNNNPLNEHQQQLKTSVDEQLSSCDRNRCEIFTWVEPHQQTKYLIDILDFWYELQVEVEAVRNDDDQSI